MFIQQGCIKLINIVRLFFFQINALNKFRKKNNQHNGTNVSNSDNNKKCFLNSKSAY